MALAIGVGVILAEEVAIPAAVYQLHALHRGGTFVWAMSRRDQRAWPVLRALLGEPAKAADALSRT